MFNTINAQVLAGFMAMILLILTMAAKSLFNSKNIMGTGTKTSDAHYSIEHVQEVGENILNIETGSRGFLLRGNESYLAPYVEGKDAVNVHLSKAMELNSDNALIISNLKTFKKSFDTWMNTSVDLLIKSKRNLMADRITMAEFEAAVDANSGKELMNQMREALSNVEDEKSRQLTVYKAESDEAYSNSIWFTVCVTLFALVVGLGLSSVITRRLKRKLDLANRHIHALAQGKLNSDIKVSGKDEVDQLLMALSKAQTNLRGLIDGIRNTTSTLSESAGSVRVSSDEMNKAASEQADATSSMAAAVEQLTVSISQITDNSNEASYTAMQAKQSADQGSETLNQVVDGIRRIATSVQGSATTVRSLEKQSNEISEIISTITDIANRTNLLALNAAIEAARAGESGRGFAVVADEVRKLAEQTKGSSERISSMVFQIQNITQQATKSMEDSVELVQDGIKKSDTVSETIQTIKTNADLVNVAIQAISVSMKEQSNVSVEISRNVERVAQMTEENTAAIGQNRDVAQEIADFAGSLTQSVQVFKT